MPATSATRPSGGRARAAASAATRQTTSCRSARRAARRPHDVLRRGRVEADVDRARPRDEALLLQRGRSRAAARAAGRRGSARGAVAGERAPVRPRASASRSARAAARRLRPARRRRRAEPRGGAQVLGDARCGGRMSSSARRPPAKRRLRRPSPRRAVERHEALTARGDAPGRPLSAASSDDLSARSAPARRGGRRGDLERDLLEHDGRRLRRGPAREVASGGPGLAVACVVVARDARPALRRRRQRGVRGRVLGRRRPRRAVARRAPRTCGRLGAPSRRGGGRARVRERRDAAARRRRARGAGDARARRGGRHRRGQRRASTGSRHRDGEPRARAASHAARR